MLKNQLEIAGSKDLQFAMKQISEIKNEGNHITTMLSHSDLIQLGGYAAVQYCGGPIMEFKMGRIDVESEGDAVYHDSEVNGTSLISEGLNKADLTPEEFVALMGHHTLGFVGLEKKGPHTRWCMNPYVFDNTYFKELLLRDQSKYFKTQADLRLLQDDSHKQWVEAYAQDQDLFFKNYASAHVKVSEINSNVMSEIEPHQTVDGGYQETNMYLYMTRLLNLPESSHEEEQRVIEEETMKELRVEQGFDPVLDTKKLS